MKLTYDPGDKLNFWESIHSLPGYPTGEDRPIKEMIFESEALFRLPQVLKNVAAEAAQTVLLVMDGQPMQRGAASLKPLVSEVLVKAGWKVQPLVLSADATGQVHTDMPHIDSVRRQLLKGMAVLGVGSGTVCDITKHACHLFDLETGAHTPFVMFQTANSVSAFTSNMAPTFIEGVKRTLPSRYPDALVCDLETLRDAPAEMTVAGVGDLLAIYVSLPDWFLAHELGLDPGYSELAQRLMGPLDELFLAHAEGIRTRQLEAMALLAKLIALGGLAMSLSHATTPMSGFEHVISHVLDLQAELTSSPLAQHGSQVSLASILGCGAYQHFLAEFVPEKVDQRQVYPPVNEMRIKVKAAFNSLDPTGKAGEACWADYRPKLEAWRSHKADLKAVLANWPDISSGIKQLTRAPERLVEILKGIGAPLTFADLQPPETEAQVKFAFMSAPLYRKRLTIGDLLVFLDWDREKLWSQLWKSVS